MEETIEISTETIPLGQFLKLANIIETGGMARWFLNEYDVYVNDERETRRGRKLRDGDRVVVEGAGTFNVVQMK
ncbi:S4 domain protein YaaA [Melghiribacillus thermohalophilus]|uniref:S4 domain protein YaaA n=1 Tax=Melghiribacillus thermohalophilus TaxID=1324956 RepID=A0A4V2V2D0_9BACI|nr:S4 domain-containing protein YaaA [Melghiribacillus thermohalophilus]TCT24632.1 S4 domain protein YaaA [Melghiribacillus thermohalophilus]